MKILVTGKDNFSYNRTQVLLSGLSQMADVELIYYPIENHRSFDKLAFTALSQNVDIVYIPPFRHSDVKFIKKYSKSPVVLDALITKYLTRTIDHGKWWTAWEKKWRDRVAFKHSDLIVMDTEAHRRYIVDLYGLDPNKVISVPVGVDTSLFKPKEAPPKNHFLVGFYGGFIPLQGVDKIVQAAHLLREHKDIRFEIIGKGPDYNKVMKLAKNLAVSNIDFKGWVAYDELNDRINNYDLCLGIFGDSLKADLVVPNKIYHYAALGKCMITKDTIGVREVLKNDKNAILIEASPVSLAESILRVRESKTTRDEIGQRALSMINDRYNHRKIADIFLQKVTDVLNKAI